MSKRLSYISFLPSASINPTQSLDPKYTSYPLGDLLTSSTIALHVSGSTSILYPFFPAISKQLTILKNRGYGSLLAKLEPAHIRSPSRR